MEVTDKRFCISGMSTRFFNKMEEEALLRMTEQERKVYLMFSMKYVTYLDEEMNLFYQGGKSNV